MAKIDTSDLDAFRARVKAKVDSGEQQAFFESCAREMAARLIAKAIKRTPVGVGSFEVTGYNKGKPLLKRLTTGGTLRRGWTSTTEQEAEKGSSGNVKAFSDGLPVKKKGTDYNITVTNPVHYASFVEYGHRQEVGRFVPVLGKRLVKSWVAGQFMLKKSADELNADANAILQKKLDKYLREIMNGK